MARGRRAQEALMEDTTPGKVLLLALVANAPVFLAFIVWPLFHQGDRASGLGFLPYIVYGTPIVALGALVVWIRAPRERKAHNAARLGLLLTIAAFVMWLLVVLSPALRA